MTTPKEFVLKEVSFVWSQFKGGGGTSFDKVNSYGIYSNNTS